MMWPMKSHWQELEEFADYAFVKGFFFILHVALVCDSNLIIYVAVSNGASVV